jgi:HPt (histidine-containing phosphotransfer) domain-containing protein
MDDHLTKPLMPADLVRALAFQPPPRPGTVSRSTSPAIDIAHLEALKLPLDVLSQIIQDWFALAPPRLAKLRAAAIRGDAQSAAHEAHALCGASRTLGATEVAKILAHVETEAKRGSVSVSDVDVVDAAYEAAVAGLSKLVKGWSEGAPSAAEATPPPAVSKARQAKGGARREPVAASVEPAQGGEAARVQPPRAVRADAGPGARPTGRYAVR